MPNTLAHLGVQGLTTRVLIRDADFKWIYLGCIIPDLPWILQRVVKYAFTNIDLFDLRLYTVVQSSLLFCLILSLALATVSVQFWRTFLILSLGSFFHLLLDACQTKWANGVHFLVPFDWHLTNFGLFWPESLVTYFLTGFGLFYLLWNWKRAVSTPIHFVRRPAVRVIGLIVLTAVYFVGPVFLLDDSEAANNHFVKTLRARHERPGSEVEFDRNNYIYQPGRCTLVTFTGETLQVDCLEVDYPATISAHGTFVSENQIRIYKYHVHSPWFRDTASYLGLTLVATLWVASLVKQKLK